MSIKNWPASERPREKLLEKGVMHLSDAELLAVLLRTGTQGMSAVDMARMLLNHFGSLRAVMTASQKTLCQHKGLGSAAFAQFATVLEIGRRVLSEELQQQPLLKSPQAVADFLRLRIGHEAIEVSLALFLDSQNRLIACEELSRGTVAENTVYIREVAKRALHHQATGLIFAHNHPAGSLTPSDADIGFTQKLQQALLLLDVMLLDHFIVTPQHTVSFAQQGYLTL